MNFRVCQLAFLIIKSTVGQFYEVREKYHILPFSGSSMFFFIHSQFSTFNVSISHLVHPNRTLGTSFLQCRCTSNGVCVCVCVICLVVYRMNMRVFATLLIPSNLMKRTENGEHTHI